MLEHAIMWHLYPLGATGADIRDTHAPGRGMASLSPWLDYAVELGCDTILLAPVFDSVSHGYDTLDHFHIDPRLGGDAEFDAFLAHCRKRGLRVLLDGVFNHVAAAHPWARQGLTTGRGWEGHDDLLELDHANPAVAEAVVEVMEYWLNKGIAGWRLDVAYAVPDEFWAEVTDRVRSRFPDAVFSGEVIHGDYGHELTAGHLDTVTQYELWKAMWSSVKDGNFFELQHALGRHNAFLDAGFMQTFVGNHDTDRIASVVGDTGAKLAATMLLTLPGVPSIYYGDEQAFRGVRGEGFTADDAVRPELPASPEELAEDGRWLFERYRQLIGLRRRHPWLVDARTEVTAVANEEITYRVERGDDWVEVALSAAGRASVRSSDGETLEL